MSITFSETSKIWILDGSFGSQLNKYVEKKIDGDPLWSARSLADNPEAVVKVHLDYIRAGSDIIETNTYQASVPGFMKHLSYKEDDAKNLIKKAVGLVRNAIDKAKDEGILNDRKCPLIAGSIGPYAAYLHDGSEYRGHYPLNPQNILREFHQSRIQALVDGGIDLFAIETIPSKEEAEIIVELIKQYPQIKAWLSFSCKVDEVVTAHGDNFVESCNSCLKLNPEQIIAVGVNCIAPHAVEILLKELHKAQPEIALIVYANSGEKYNPNTGWDNNYEKLEEYIPSWLNLGVKVIGGCCRICDNYLEKIVKEVRKWEEQNNNQ